MVEKKYIECEKVVELFNKWSDGYSYIEVPTKDAIACVRVIPAADVRPVVRGKWEYSFRDDDGLEIVECICSVCHGYKESYARWLYDDGNRNWFNFCPNCGADMREES